MELLTRKFTMLGAYWTVRLVCTVPSDAIDDTSVDGSECDATTKTLLLFKGGYNVMFASYASTWDTAFAVIPADGQCTYGHNEKGFVLESMLGIAADYPFGT